MIDGGLNTGIGYQSRTFVKGDQKSMSIAAASILAKVSRDRFMVAAAQDYPQYGFENHKGYGTAAHIEAIREFGLCPLHRKTFMTAKVLGDFA